MHLLRFPPELTQTVSWRALWRGGAFIQAELISDSGFISQARERGVHLDVGQRQVERFDRQGALQPVAFAGGHAPHHIVDYQPYEPIMTFREEKPESAWATYAWRSRSDRPRVSPLYSTWQLLYVDDVAGGLHVPVKVERLLTQQEAMAAPGGKTRWVLEDQQARWRTLDEAWRPLIKLLVRLQNRYMPEVTGQAWRPFDDHGQRVNVWPAEYEQFEPTTVLAEVGATVEQVTESYWFLVERGLEREPHDGLETLRRARPRSCHRLWRGPVRSAQDHFDAAELLRRFLIGVMGEPPAGPPWQPADGRQPERAVLYEAGPASWPARKALQDRLVQAGLYPHGVHVVGEGRSEREIVSTLVAGILGDQVAAELGFTDLGGSGAASRLTTMVNGFTTYAERTVVIVDREGDMARYVEGLIRDGQLPPEDVLLFDRNLEESNFQPAELLDVLTKHAANPPGDRSAVTLRLSLPDVEAAHKEQLRKRRRAAERSGLAGTLLKLAEDPAYGGPVRMSKPEFATTLAERILDDLDAAGRDDAMVDAIVASRPLLKFVVERMFPVLTGPRWR